MATHVPVLLKETLEILSPKAGDSVLDVTLGLGGHSEAMLKLIGESGSLVALDADEENIAHARKRLEPFKKNLEIVHANFSSLPDCLPADKRVFDVILADLGLSSPHIDEPERGFTFRTNSPLDMRFDRTSGMTAAMLLASVDAATLFDIFVKFGELPMSGKLTEKIIERRKGNPVRTSDDLLEVARETYGFQAPKRHAQIFQALRMAVNREVEALENLLTCLPSLLSVGGRAVVISYHSLEDSLVKSYFRTLTTSKKDLLTGSVSVPASFELLTRKAVMPSEDEIRLNPRSRSARLRAIMKTREYTDHRPSAC